MNAAILVGNVARKNKSWKDAIVELEKFWRDGVALKEGPTPMMIFRLQRCFQCFLGGDRGRRTFVGGDLMEKNIYKRSYFKRSCQKILLQSFCYRSRKSIFFKRD
jgi:hypothetical protein